VYIKTDTGALDGLKHFDQVRHRPAQPIRRPHRNHVELAPDRGLQQRIKLRALVAALGARNFILKCCHHRATGIRGPLLEGEALIFIRLALVPSGHPGNRALHVFLL
jgi:hypothetical protein